MSGHQCIEQQKENSDSKKNESRNQRQMKAVGEEIDDGDDVNHPQ